MYRTCTKAPVTEASLTDAAAIEARLTEMESRLAFQEAIIEELNQALMQQTLEINKQRQQLRLLAEKLQQSPLALATEETPPPHY